MSNKVMSNKVMNNRGQQRTSIGVILLNLLAIGTYQCSVTIAFSPTNSLSLKPRRTTFNIGTTTSSNSIVKSNQDSNDPFDALELTSTLARLDQQWKIQQKKSPQTSRWTKLVLPRIVDDDDEDGENNEFSNDNVRQQQQKQSSKNEDDDGIGPNEFVYLLEPPNKNIPSCLIVFVGGAGLGQFPNIAYSEFLTRVSDTLNAAVIAAPYQVGLDHFALSKSTGERIRKAILLCEEEPSKLYPPSLPTYCVCHSLGCKLQTIYMAATGQQYEGMGFISFNNFDFAQTISMVRNFASEVRNQYRKEGGGTDPSPFGSKSSSSSFFEKDGDDVLGTIFGLAENIIGAVGVDFSPNSVSTQRLIQLKYTKDLQRKTRLFVFDDDTLDSSEQFVMCCSQSQQGDVDDEQQGNRVVTGDNDPPLLPLASALPGTHLTPVYFKLGINDMPSQEARDIASEALGGFQSASFGDENNLNQLVQEVCDWILGKEPSRRQTFQKSQVQSKKLPQITGN